MITIVILSYFFSLISFLPSSGITHYSVRLLDFVRIQVTLSLIIILGLSFLLPIENGYLLISAQIAAGISIVFQASIILPYLPIRKFFSQSKKRGPSITILSVNVLQKNNNYQELIKLIKELKPNILLTMETNKEWEKALSEIETDYSYSYKIPKENRYGMHFYTNLQVNKLEEHYLISDERPAIKVQLTSNEDHQFVFWGIHPPPPSPTEKPTSRQKDAELVKVAKLIGESDLPCIITGDFNNVCWSKSAKLFSKISNLKDARLNNGIHGTFPVKPWIFRFPIDLIFSSKEIEVTKIKTLKDIGSDHLPIFSQFTLNSSISKQKPNLDSETINKAESIIKEGNQAVEEEEEE